MILVATAVASIGTYMINESRKAETERNKSEAEKYSAEANLENAKSKNYSTPLRYAIIAGGAYALYSLYKK